MAVRLLKAMIGLLKGYIGYSEQWLTTNYAVWTVLREEILSNVWIVSAI
jgi:hypothetical protein